tara:strand:- start:46362 stop:46679 length:318 start_codon:yes stop_codon:yes gene_type:complete
MAEYFDRYKNFKENGVIKPIPGLKIEDNNTDKNVVYKLGETRLDILSQKYYNNPYHGYLIMLANPQYGGLEFNIKDRDIIRVPFPFNSAIERYLESVEKYKKLYG